ncbi:hypothetical protein WA026_016575 [Henosepilachna vigintioctopunctata]|uniref:Uncharacterized protein n=1 Tax=Henosepilachna vigintioctopunctata TaxID=420089 RepID=A0AAW1V7W1_9CUCU
MKRFVKAMTTERDCFEYIISAFPSLSHEKIKARVFDGPQIRQLLKKNVMTEPEKNARLAFKSIVKDFLGNTRAAQNYIEIVQQLSESLKKLGCNMSIQLHFLHNHLSNSSENLGAVSDEQGERIYQGLKAMETRYQG